MFSPTLYGKPLTVGTGLDYMQLPHLVAGIHFNYDNFKFDRSAIANDGTTSTWSNTKSNDYVVTARLSYLFGWKQITYLTCSSCNALGRSGQVCAAEFAASLAAFSRASLARISARAVEHVLRRPLVGQVDLRRHPDPWFSFRAGNPSSPLHPKWVHSRLHRCGSSPDGLCVSTRGLACRS